MFLEHQSITLFMFGQIYHIVLDYLRKNMTWLWSTLNSPFSVCQICFLEPMSKL